MKSDVSALADGELEVHEVAATFAALHSDGQLRQAWDHYQMIGAALRKEDALATSLTSRVMAELDNDVTVFAPPVARAQPWHRPLLAIAASLAGIAVVGWLAFSLPASQTPQVTLAKVAPNQVEAKPVLAKAPTAGARREMQDYLVAHQAHVPATQVLGGTQHIRTVASGLGDDGR